MSTMLPAVLCPHCGHTLDHHTDAIKSGKSKPSPGDIGICVGCYSPLVFDNDLKLRAASDDEIGEIPAEILEKLFMAKLLKNYAQRERETQPKETRQ